ncbi:MAG: ThiF family adenylyltransferase [Congregibacter sp.]
MLSDSELERYSRQLMLPGFELEQQARLRAATVLVVGCGGLGNPLALYLAAAGVGGVILADGDQVERSNLHRQILFTEADLGHSKAVVAARVIGTRFVQCTTRVLEKQLRAEDLVAAVSEANLVADCSDNYATRFALNRACIASGTPLVSAAAIRSEGQLTTLDPARGGPCYRCIYPSEETGTALACRDSGVMGPVVGVLGTLQALEVIKNLSGWGETLRGKLLLLDLYTNEQRLLLIDKKQACPDCSS